MPNPDFHFTRTIPIATVVAVLINIGAVVWFVAKTDSRVEALERWKIETSMTRFTEKDGEILSLKIENNKIKMDKNETKLDKMAADIVEIKVALGVPSKNQTIGG